MNKLTATRLREVLMYYPEVGIFVWKVSTNRRIFVGKTAGTLSHGRIQIRIDGVIHRAHRLAWLYVHGRWPTYHIDHINGNPVDNSIANLRDVDQKTNIQNQRKPHSRNVCGLLGVSPMRSGGKIVAGKYRARIDARHLGVFNSPEEAHLAYLSAKRIQHIGGTL